MDKIGSKCRKGWFVESIVGTFLAPTLGVEKRGGSKTKKLMLSHALGESEQSYLRSRPSIKNGPKGKIAATIPSRARAAGIFRKLAAEINVSQSPTKRKP